MSAVSWAITGDITGGTNVSPVYGGLNINNLNSGGLNTFNYYAYDELKSKAIPDNNYNCALAIEEKNLKRFEFYRLLLNSNRRLAAYYATSSYGTVHEEDMMKFVLETADRSIVAPNVPKPYPVLKPQDKYPSIINYDVEHAPSITLVDGKPSEEDRNKGGQLGTLSVTISQGSGAPDGATITTGSLTLTRTDKDPERFNFNYDKVQLPYYNDVGTKNYTGNKVVTGWKITGITAVDGDPYTISNYPASGAKDYPDYNFADRKSSNKDLNSVSGRVFSQGAYFDVPYGVSAITIEPYWGTAAYIADEYLDVVYNTAATYASQKVTQLGNTFPTGKITIDGSEQDVYTSFTDALSKLSGATVYDNAVVLVGNLHQENVPSDGTKPFTVMSADLNQDNEPDYSMIYHHPGRKVICPIRFDFLNIPGTAQAQKPTLRRHRSLTQPPASLISPSSRQRGGLRPRTRCSSIPTRLNMRTSKTLNRQRPMHLSSSLAEILSSLYLHRVRLLMAIRPISMWAAMYISNHLVWVPMVTVSSPRPISQSL